MNSNTSTKHFKPQKLQRPSHSRDFGANFKLHLRRLTIGARTYHVLSPRPGTQVAWSTNYYHETWHIVSGESSAHYLARLLWGLAFQKQPNTLIYLGGEFLRPTPFDGEPSDPIVLASAHLTPLDAKHLKILRERMQHPTPPDGTVRWQTWGLDEVHASEPDRDDYEARLRWWESQPWGVLLHREERKIQRPQEVARRAGGCVCYCAPPLVLQETAWCIARMKAISAFGGTDYHYLAERSGGWGGDGEIQIFSHYDRMVDDAQRARHELEAERGVSLLRTDRDRIRVYTRRAKIEQQRARSKMCRRLGQGGRKELHDAVRESIKSAPQVDLSLQPR